MTATKPCYVLTSKASRDRGAFIVCVSGGECVIVQLNDFIAAPEKYSSTVWSTDDLDKAQRALSRARARARDWRVSASSIGIYDAAPAIAKEAA